MKTLFEIKAQTILDRLKFFEGNRVHTAESLEVSIRSLRNWIATLRCLGYSITDPIRTKTIRSKKMN